MLGLSNAATPLGLRAMEDLEKLNRHPGVATNAMCTFLTINTAGLQLIPASMIGLMASAGSKDPTAIIGTTLAATFVAAICGVTAAKLLEKLRFFSVERANGGSPQ
jgi:spore maturation protein A